MSFGVNAIFLLSGVKGQQREPLHDLMKPKAGKRKKTFQGRKLCLVPSSGVTGKSADFEKRFASTEFQTRTNHVLLPVIRRIFIMKIILIFLNLKNK